MASVPEQFHDLLRPETRAFAHLALVLRDGSPHVTPIRFDYDADRSLFIFNTVRGHVKDRVMRRHPRVAFEIADPTTPYRYVQVRGTVVDEAEEGGVEQINALSQKYTGNSNYTLRPGEVLVTYRVRADRVSTMGPWK
jgi:PPOX class probable F420-dependent enzyme